MNRRLLSLTLALLPCLAAAEEGDPSPTSREKRILELKKTAAELGDHDFRTSDCAPAAPFVVCTETSVHYNADLIAGAFKEALVELYKLFKDRFGAFYDARALEADQACLVYVFESRERFAGIIRPPEWSCGAFDPARGALVIYKDSSQLYETLFSEGARQLLATIARTKDPKAGDPTMFWLSTGIATWFESFKRDARGGVVLGGRAAGYLPFARKLITDGKSLKLDEFLRITSADFAKKTGRKEVVALTGQAWAFWYFMQTAKDGAYRDKLDAYFKKEMEQKGGHDAAKECFGDLEALNAEYEEFIRELK